MNRKGEYGEGDQFLGIAVPEIRRVARAHRDLTLADLTTLLASPLHELRTTALQILGMQFARADEDQKTAIYQFYVSQLARVNSWDLVDGSAPQIAGAYLLKRDRKILHKLARSKSLWERRVAMVATQALISAGESAETFAIAEKAARRSGRSHSQSDRLDAAPRAGKRVSETELRGFLKKHASRMPRTALRYAIERFSPEEREQWLSIKRDV